jgi:zinc transport system substrate-binding protein
MKNRLFIIPLVCMLALSIMAATPLSNSASETNPLEVTVSILPQKYFVERIGGDKVKVNVMVLPGESPATYEPSPEQMTALSKSVAYVSIGVPFEKAWLEKMLAANKNMILVDTTKGIERTATADGGFDPHIWLSPRLVKTQSETIYQALAKIDPSNADTYKKNYEAFVKDIDDLDSDIKTTIEKTSTKKFIVFHPAWGYFARDYGLEMIAVEVGGQEPSAKELASLIKKAKDEKIKVVFTQPEFDQKAAETIAKEIDGEVIKIGPLNPDWLKNLETVAETFANALK